MVEAKLVDYVPAWKSIAHRFFFEEFEEEKKFYETYSEPASVYMELARRVTSAAIGVDIVPTTTLANFGSSIFTNATSATQSLIDAAAYKTMYQAFTEDIKNHNNEELGHLAFLYEELYKGVE